MDRKDKLDGFFHGLSKYLWIVPVAIIVLGLYLRYNGYVSPVAEKQKPMPTAQPALTNEEEDPPATAAAEFNMEGPLVCHVFTPEGLLDAYVKEGKVSIQIEEKTKNYLLYSGDCVYAWDSGKYSGEKFCGIQPYISVFKALFTEGMVEDGLLGLLNKVGGELEGSRSAQLKAVIQSCRKSEIEDLSVFDIPQNVIFKNIPLEELIK